VKKIQLITTSLETIEDQTTPIFLGNWCKADTYLINSQKIVKYYWDDRDQLEQDYKYLNNLCENLLKELTQNLNKIHNRDCDIEYWRLLIGLWLLHFSGTLFERWKNIQNAISQFEEINYFKKYKFNSDHVPLNLREFSYISQDTKWNHLIYSRIIEYLKKKHNLKIDIDEQDEIKDKFYFSYKISFIHRFKKGLLTFYQKFFGFLIKRNKFVIFKSYTGLTLEFFLNLFHMQLPVFFVNKDFQSKTDYSLRNKIKINLKSENLFEDFLFQNICDNMPKDVLEDFKNIEKYIQENNYPKKPNIIISSRTMLGDNIFLRYCAEMKRYGSKFFYGQHGGVYGHAKFSVTEDHEVKVSSKFLSWGWTSPDEPKIIPFGLLKNIENFKFRINKKISKACYFIRARSKYTNRIDSSVGSNQMAKYYNYCLNFFDYYKSLNLNISITPRFHEAKFGWNHEEIWENKYSNIEITTTNQESLKKVYKKYDILIYSYISTGFLESLSLDKPFLLISPLQEWPLRKTAHEDFMKLKQAKIFFEDNEAALNHLISIKENIYEWWDSQEIKKIKINFKNKYAISLNKYNKFNKFNELLINEKI
jgi:putative transferase (TIGR04331 family)